MAAITASPPSLPTGTGFTDPVRDSQRVFRTVLDALSRPGSLRDVPSTAEAPRSLHAASAAICLALVDHETRLWLDPKALGEDAARYFQFHCGATLVFEPALADFAILAGSAVPLDAFKTGSDAYPDEGATIIVQTEAISSNGADDLELRGPGIDDRRAIRLEGLPDGFWSQRRAAVSGFPRGIDLIFTAGTTITAIPRTTTVTEVRDPA